MKTTIFATVALAVVAFITFDVAPYVSNQIAVDELERDLQEQREIRALQRECRLAFPRNHAQQQWCVREGQQ